MDKYEILSKLSLLKKAIIFNIICHSINIILIIYQLLTYKK